MGSRSGEIKNEQKEAKKKNLYMSENVSPWNFEAFITNPLISISWISGCLLIQLVYHPFIIQLSPTRLKL